MRSRRADDPMIALRHLAAALAFNAGDQAAAGTVSAGAPIDATTMSIGIARLMQRRPVATSLNTLYDELGVERRSDGTFVPRWHNRRSYSRRPCRIQRPDLAADIVAGAAPVTFSISTIWLSQARIRSAMMRAIVSVDPPAAYGTIIVIRARWVSLRTMPCARPPGARRCPLSVPEIDDDGIHGVSLPGMQRPFKRCALLRLRPGAPLNSWSNLQTRGIKSNRRHQKRDSQLGMFAWPMAPRLPLK